MRNIEEIERSKWTFLFLFLVADLAQILFVSLIALDDQNPFLISLDIMQKSPLTSLSLFVSISLLQLFLLYMVVGSMLRKRRMKMIYPERSDPEKWDSRYSQDELVSWTRGLAERSEVTVDRIYVMESPMPNAFTFSLPLLGSIVVLYSNLMDLLKPEEVKSIITHELGHIRNNDSPIQILLRMPSFFVHSIYLYIYLRLGLGIASAMLVNFNPFIAGVRFFILLCFIGLSRLMMTISLVLLQRSSRDAELLCDYHAAKVMGVRPTINALIRLGQRVEAISALVDEVKWLESLNPERRKPIDQSDLEKMILAYPLDGIDENNAREVAPELFLTRKLKHMRETYGISLSDEQIKEAVRPAIESLTRQRKEQKSEEPKPGSGTVEWRDADLDSDERLSEKEIGNLVELLRANPDSVMFETEVGAKILLLSHPDFKRRILQLYEIFPQ